jgi:hypothetical protein
MTAFLAETPGIAGTSTQAVVTNADGTVVYVFRETVVSPHSSWNVTAAGLIFAVIILAVVIVFRRRSKST